MRACVLALRIRGFCVSRIPASRGAAASGHLHRSGKPLDGKRSSARGACWRSSGLAELLAMTPWFSATAVAPAIGRASSTSTAPRRPGSRWRCRADSWPARWSARCSTCRIWSAPRWVFALGCVGAARRQRHDDRGAIARRGGRLALRDRQRAGPRLSAGHEDRGGLVQRQPGRRSASWSGASRSGRPCHISGGPHRRLLAVADAALVGLAVAGGCWWRVTVTTAPCARRARRSIPRRRCACSAGAPRGSASSATSATCGSSTPCGPGSGVYVAAALAAAGPRRRAPGSLAAFVAIGRERPAPSLAGSRGPAAAGPAWRRGP